MIEAKGDETVKTCLDEAGLKIVREIYRALDGLGADSGLLSVVGSWGDTLDDADILDCLQSHNCTGKPFRELGDLNS